MWQCWPALQSGNSFTASQGHVTIQGDTGRYGGQHEGLRTFLRPRWRWSCPQWWGVPRDPRVHVIQRKAPGEAEDSHCLLPSRARTVAAGCHHCRPVQDCGCWVPSLQAGSLLAPGFPVLGQVASHSHRSPCRKPGSRTAGRGLTAGCRGAHPPLKVPHVSQPEWLLHCVPQARSQVSQRHSIAQKRL